MPYGYPPQNQNPAQVVKTVLREFKDAVLFGDRLSEHLLDEYAGVIFEFFNEIPMTRKEAAAFLNVSLPTFDKLRKSGLVIEHYAGERKKWGRPHFLRSELVLLRNQPLSGHLGHQEA